MNIFNIVKEKITNKVKDIITVKDKIFMEQGSSVVCKDSNNGINKQVSIIASHINENYDEPQTFPRFDVVKTVSKDGSYSTHKEYMFSLAADKEPTEGSKNLLTSGALYEIINDLQMQINELKSNKQ